MEGTMSFEKQLADLFRARFPMEAQRIVNQRERIGGFTTRDEFMREGGVRQCWKMA